ncbi:MAG: type II secretion system F family protein, partial [Rhodothermia bacterium]|nr:type II secretion system F family protein [Rhodothermia bacterium]
MAVKEFKFTGLGSNGQPVQGTVFAQSKRVAKQKVETLAEKHKFRPGGVQERSVYLYKVRHPNGKIVNGEQKAFSQEEISSALSKMGLEVLKVNKKFLDVQRKPPRTDMIMFVRLAANLLKEKLPFDEVLNLLVNDVSSNSLKQVIRDLNADLKSGMEAQQAFMKHQHMLGKFTAYMLGIASRSGNMAEIYEATARFLERQNEFKKSIRSAMITPAITVLVLIAAFVWYVWYIFPQTAGLFEGFGIELPPMTAKTLDFSKWLDRNYVWVLGLHVAVGLGLFFFARSQQGRFWIHKNLIRIPIIGTLLHKLNIEIFCRVFSVLYSGSGDNISVIKIAAEACGNSYMEHRVKTITVPMMVAQGAELVRSMEASGVFTQMALARFRSGSETGNVRSSAQQMADYYEAETTLKLKEAVEGIQTIVAIIITIAICFLTVISSEIALISPSST